jgi:F-type H+/Na+-transporting ATPase subunit alpha
MPDSSVHMIRIVSPVELDREKGQKIAARFAKHLNIKDFAVSLETDHSLIGGMVIFAGGFRYDHSVKGQLSRIISKLKTQELVGTEGTAAETAPAGLIKDNLQDALSTFDELPVAPGAQDIFSESELLTITGEEAASQTMADSLHAALESFMAESTIDEVGEVISVSDDVAYVRGIQNCRNSEVIMFSHHSFGIAMNLEEDRVGVVLLQEDESIREGSICRRTGTTVSVPTGKPLLGRVVDPLGSPIDGLGLISTLTRRPIESPAPSIIDRQQVNRSLHTGITAIDAMTPIGRGQRELIIGDRQTGKTALAVDTIINQRGKDVYCVYVAIGQKMSTIASVVNTLQIRGAMDYTTIVVASASASAAMQFIAPYAGCAMAEELMYREKADVLIIYDDLTKHAQAYRAMSLLLRRPPGREAYPGDVFYLHSRLLERSARLGNSLGGGSITAMPIVETQSGDISAYIPTNVISITDGQIYLESGLFFSGQRPAINVGLSVSRVGGAAQSKAMKKVAGPLRINLAQYRELESFSQFGSELDDETIKQLKIGERVIEVLKQPQYSPLAMEVQVIMLYLANQGVLTGLNKEDVQGFLHDFIQNLRDTNSILLHEIASSGQFTETSAITVNSAVNDYLDLWKIEHEDYGTSS